MEEFKILNQLQFGFREKCSTNHALISITESIRQSIDNNEFGCGIFIAFDTVNHTILLTISLTIMEYEVLCLSGLNLTYLKENNL